MNVYTRTLNALTPLGVPLAAQKMIAADASSLPDVYLTYFLVSSVPVQSADDAETERRQRMQVTAWSRGGLTSLPNVPGAMTAAGFMRGEERELSRDPDTGHFGLAMDFLTLEEQNGS